MYSGKLKIERRLFDERVKRFSKFVEMKSPDCVVQMAALLIVESFHDPLRDKWDRMILRQPYYWIAWLFSAEYRQCCRDVDTQADAEFEEEMRRMFKEGK